MGDDDRSEEYTIFKRSGFKTRIMEILEDWDDVELFDLSKIN